MNAAAALGLLDWKRRVFALYAQAREVAEADPAKAWDGWCAGRDALFAAHACSPLAPETRARFGGLPLFPYDPATRVLAEVEEAEPERIEIAASGPEPMAFTRIGRAAFALQDSSLTLDMYWLEAYGGGLFVPFADATSGGATYGAGRYLLDTVKGADLGTQDGALVLDFNFAYHPSCAHDPRWACPLAPAANRLGVAVEAGERLGGPEARTT